MNMVILCVLCKHYKNALQKKDMFVCKFACRPGNGEEFEILDLISSFAKDINLKSA